MDTSPDERPSGSGGGGGTQGVPSSGDGGRVEPDSNARGGYPVPLLSTGEGAGDGPASFAGLLTAKKEDDDPGPQGPSWRHLSRGKDQGYSGTKQEVLHQDGYQSPGPMGIGDDEVDWDEEVERLYDDFRRTPGPDGYLDGQEARESLAYVQKKLGRLIALSEEITATLEDSCVLVSRALREREDPAGSSPEPVKRVRLCRQ